MPQKQSKRKTGGVAQTGSPRATARENKRTIGFRLSPRWITIALLAVFFAIAIYFRVYLPYNTVFTSAGVKFSSVDAYWHMRIVDNLLANFPHLIAFDPYQIFPGGEGIDRVHFFDWLLAGIIKILSFGNPSEALTDKVAAYFPAILGALTIFPVYFIGKTLANRWAGLISAGIIATLPGEFLGRSILGFTDHHVAESLFSATAVMFLMLAVKCAGERNISLDHLRKQDWNVLRRPLIYTALAGISLGIYMITWVGALLFVFLIAVFFLIQSIIDHLRGKTGEYLFVVGVPMFIVTSVLALPFYSGSLVNISMPLVVLGLVILALVSWYFARRKLAPYVYPVTIVGVAVIALLAFKLINNSLLSVMLSQFSLFSPTGPQAQTTLEMQGLLFPGGQFSWDIAWGNYNFFFFVAILMILILAVFMVRQDLPHQNLFLIWGLVILLSALGQRRFGYYLAVNIALLSGYGIWLCLWYVGIRFTGPKPVPEMPPTAKAPPRRPKSDRASVQYGVLATVVGLIILVPTTFLDLRASATITDQSRFAPSDAWCSAMAWMKTSTPEPFGDPAYYYKEYDATQSTFKYPPTAYGVAAWWDFGYWITQMSHRIPSANPGQNPAPIKNVASLFLSTNDTAAGDAMKKMQASYVVIDYKTVTSIFWAIAVWGGHEQTEYSDIYYTSDKNSPNQLQPVRVFYPEFYRTTVARLYNFDGQAVTNETPLVITYTDTQTQEGATVKRVTDARQFVSYNDAKNYVDNQKGVKTRIVSNNPFISPVALDALKGFKEAYASPQNVTGTGAANQPEVKIFQFTP